jgi:hypothetical protein
VVTKEEGLDCLVLDPVPHLACLGALLGGGLVIAVGHRISRIVQHLLHLSPPRHVRVSAATHPCPSSRTFT